jgi:hypothetical protein
MDAAAYPGWITGEISVMVQRRPDYDPAEVARTCFRVLTPAAAAAGVTVEELPPTQRWQAVPRSTTPASPTGRP